MECQKCGKAPAKVFLTQIVNGKMLKVDLCENCAREMGVTNTEGFSMADLFLSMGLEKKGGEQPHLLPPPVALEEAICEHCGYTLEDLKKTGKLGCAECYKTFEGTLEEVLREVQKKPSHQGKVPARQIRMQGSLDHLKELEISLQEAISNERFEEAARLRDEIRILRESLK